MRWGNMEPTVYAEVWSKSRFYNVSIVSSVSTASRYEVRLYDLAVIACASHSG